MFGCPPGWFTEKCVRIWPLLLLGFFSLITYSTRHPAGRRPSQGGVSQRKLSCYP